MSEQWGHETAPQVPPNAKFRADLHRALEESHRQQVARRKVGAQRGGESSTAARQLIWIAAWLVLLGVAALVFRRLKRQTAR